MDKDPTRIVRWKKDNDITGKNRIIKSLDKDVKIKIRILNIILRILNEHKVEDMKNEDRIYHFQILAIPILRSLLVS